MGDLANTYIKYCSIQNIRCKTIDLQHGFARLLISSPEVWKYFKHESGKHVVQRIPPTETKGRRQTSTISVAILPVFKYQHCLLPENEVKIDTTGGHGPGGQHQNKTESAVRAIHKPTGIQVFINGRKQLQNKKEAIRILTDRVNELYLIQEKEQHNLYRSLQIGGGSRSGKVRTYNFIQSRVVDHNLNTKTSKIIEVMKGRLDLLWK